ncbi:MAG: phosphatidate cytidylyltransferase [Oscillospiraceae bacterium]|nr:phosphatidate cytidylyltransferase [Oscillospiraceae bacterium]
MAVRLISSGVGIVIVLLAFFFHNTIVLPLLLSACVGIILFELSRAVEGTEFKLAMTGVMVYGISEPILNYLQYVIPAESAFAEPVAIARRLLLPVCLFALFIEFLWHHGSYKLEQLSFMGGAMCFVPWSLGKLIDVNYYGTGEHGLFYLVLALCGAWIADSGAYFSGVFLGKHKLCPNISPKKTVEGFVGGLISNAVIFLGVFIVYAHIRGVEFNVILGIKTALLGVICAGVSVLGDLTFSVIKREKGIKDYGKIMPGHGGLTDRFDSVLFVAPVFYLFVHAFTIF